MFALLLVTLDFVDIKHKYDQITFKHCNLFVMLPSTIKLHKIFYKSKELTRHQLRLEIKQPNPTKNEISWMMLAIRLPLIHHVIHCKICHVKNSWQQYKIKTNNHPNAEYSQQIPNWFPLSTIMSFSNHKLQVLWCWNKHTNPMIQTQFSYGG